MNRLYRRLAALFAAATALLLWTAPATATPCAINCLAPGDYTVVTLHQGLIRNYMVHVPASYTGQRAVPLLLDFHGGGVDANNERTYSGQLAESDRRGFVVVYPSGIGLTWNGYGCCLGANMLALDDVGFARSIITAMKGRTNIDADRVYATGISNGGALAQRMACEAADVVRAAVSVSFPLNSDQCRPSRPINVFEIAGTEDTNIPYYGTDGQPVVPLIGNLIGFGAVQGARESLASWKTILSCSDDLYREQLPEDSRYEEYRSCAGGVRTGLVSLVGRRHVLYNGYASPISGYDGNNAPFDLAPFIWDRFFNL